MTAYQPVPTLAQRKALQQDHERRYNRDAIGEYRAAQLCWEMERLSKQPEPDAVIRAAGEACCAVDRDEDESPALSWPVVIGCCIAGLGTWVAVGYAAWWLVGAFVGVK